jgi:hypothetical protein
VAAAVTPTDPRARTRRAGVRRRGRAHAVACALATALSAALLAGCGGTSGVAGTGAAARLERSRAALSRYLHQVEPIRLSVNRLLEGADPILERWREQRLGDRAAAGRLGALERQFAAYTVDVAAIEPSGPPAVLAVLAREYAGTYVLEDAYLSALAAGLQDDDVHGLPNTQAEQRATIVRWRTGLTVLARRTGLTLPGDLQQAGRGEIAPSPSS